MPLTELLPVIDVTACCAPLTQAALGQESAEDLARSLKALADPARLRLVSMVAAHEDAEACVCDLTGAFANADRARVTYRLSALPCARAYWLSGTRWWSRQCG